MAESNDGHGSRLGLTGLLKEIPAIVAGLAILLYGVLYLLYSRFYGPLGVPLDDVGLTYANIFVRSLGLLALLLAPFVLAGAILMLRIPTRKRHYSVNELGTLSSWQLSRLAERRRPPWNWNLRTMQWIAALIVFTITIYYIWDSFGRLTLLQAEFTSVSTQLGFPSEAPTIGPLTVMDVQVAPVELVWTSTPTPRQKALRVHTLLYLGQARGVYVLYDATTQDAVYVSSGSAVLSAVNCATRNEGVRDRRLDCGENDPINRRHRYLDLQGADLRLEFQIGLDLQRADLRKANLQGAHLIELDLARANLEEAKLDQAIFPYANLSRTNFRNASMDNISLGYCDCQAANFERASIQASFLAHANLRKANLRSAVLRGAVLYGADLRGADLKGADLSKAGFYDPKLPKAKLKGAKADNRTRWPKGLRLVTLGKPEFSSSSMDNGLYATKRGERPRSLAVR
jgi:uncharacterized protein YjbI with pentapeptide repeats